MVNTNAQSTTEVIDVVMPMFMMMIMFGMMKNIMPKSAPSKEHSQVEHLSQLYPKTGDEPPSALEVHPNRDYIWTQDGCTTGYILDTMMHQLKGGIQGPTEVSTSIHDVMEYWPDATFTKEDLQRVFDILEKANLIELA